MFSLNWFKNCSFTSSMWSSWKMISASWRFYMISFNSSFYPFFSSMFCSNLMFMLWMTRMNKNIMKKLTIAIFNTYNMPSLSSRISNPWYAIGVPKVSNAIVKQADMKLLFEALKHVILYDSSRTVTSCYDPMMWYHVSIFSNNILVCSKSYSLIACL